jgi:hypothetical protein
MGRTNTLDTLARFGIDPNSLTHHGIKGMRWGVRTSGGVVVYDAQRQSDGKEGQVIIDHGKAGPHHPAGHVVNTPEHGSMTLLGKTSDRAHSLAADAKTAIAAKALIKKSGIGAVSSADLRALVDRQTLEQRVNQMNPTRMGQFKKVLKEELALVGKNLIKQTIRSAISESTTSGLGALGKKYPKLGAMIIKPDVKKDN